MKADVTEKDRLTSTLQHREPDKVPHFEMDFQLTEEEFGMSYASMDELDKAASDRERERLLHHNLELQTMVVDRFHWCAIPFGHFWGSDWYFRGLKLAREQYVKEHAMLATFNGGGTFSIPSGQDMVEMSCRFFDHPDEMHSLAEEKCRDSMEVGKRQVEAGVELIIINTDYAFNKTPFLSPRMFSEFVTPYLHRIVDAFKQQGVWVLLHTDGNINPILDQLVSTGLDGLQSIDPQAGMDIAQVKREYGGRLTLMGNVQCSMLQDGPEEDIRRSVRYAIGNGSPGGGYIFSTSNVIFKGMPLEHYYIMLDEYEKHAWR